MPPIIRLLMFMLIPIAVELVLSLMLKDYGKELIENLSKNDIVLRLPRVCSWVGLICVLVFSFFIFLGKTSKNTTMTTWVVIGFSFFIFVGLVLIVGTETWRIYIYKDKEYFIYKTAYGKNYEIKYEDCEFFKHTNYGIVLKTKNKKFEIDSHVINYEFLLALLTKNKVKEIKESKK